MMANSENYFRPSSGRPRAEEPFVLSSKLLLHEYSKTIHEVYTQPHKRNMTEENATSTVTLTLRVTLLSRICNKTNLLNTLFNHFPFLSLIQHFHSTFYFLLKFSQPLFFLLLNMTQAVFFLSGQYLQVDISNKSLLTLYQEQSR